MRTVKTRSLLTLSLFTLAAFGLTAPGIAQARLDLPQASPHATVSQRVGLTDFKVDYSRPAVRKRRIFGGLLPYGKLWRAGANACTKLELSGAATIGGKSVPAGSYCLLAIPRRDRWTVIISRTTKLWGTRGYKPENDAARFDVKAKRAPYRDRLTFLFSDVTESTARLDLWWDRIYVPIAIQVETAKQAAANIKKAVGDGWHPYVGAARYLLEHNERLDYALELTAKSLSLKKTWYATYIKAQLLRAKKRHGEAYAALQEAKALGDKDKRFFYKDQVEKALKTWKRK